MVAMQQLQQYYPEQVITTTSRVPETLPQPLPDISRENVLKILGVTITNHLSASEHIRRIISDSAQSLCTRSSRAAPPWDD